MAAHDPRPLNDAALQGRLAGRRIVVTGAASGIGRAVAELFLRAGASVTALDRNPPAALDAPTSFARPPQERLHPLGGPGEARAGGVNQALVRAVDVTRPDAVEAAVRAAAAMGGIDGLVNAAGISNTEWADAVSLEDWRRVLDVNLTGTFIVCRACLPFLRGSDSGGTIVNLSSGQGLQPFKQRSAYAASKAGVIAVSKCLAMEWAPRVRVNTICPGAVDTPMVRAGYSAEALRTQVGPRYALERIAEPHEIAQAALYLTSTESSFVTGIVLAVDGGRSYH